MCMSKEDLREALNFKGGEIIVLWKSILPLQQSINNNNNKNAQGNGSNNDIDLNSEFLAFI